MIMCLAPSIRATSGSETGFVGRILRYQHSAVHLVTIVNGSSSTQKLEIDLDRAMEREESSRWLGKHASNCTATTA